MKSVRRIVSSSALILAAAALPALAQDQAAGGSTRLGSACIALLMAIIQLAIALAIVAFTVNQGFKLLSRLLAKEGKSLDIWAEVKKQNVAVALLAAGVVVSYCNVVGSGIAAMNKVLTEVVRQSWKHSLLGLLSGMLNLVVAIAVASFAITVVFKVMDKLTSGIDEIDELKNKNTAVGTIYCGLIIGVSFLISSGVSSIGMGVNALLGALLPS